MMRSMPPKTLHPPWPPAVVEAVAAVLGSTAWPGLSNAEIDQLFALVGIADVEAPNKHRRRSPTAVGRAAGRLSDGSG